MNEQIIDYYLHLMEISTDISETKTYLRKVWEVKREGLAPIQAR